MGPERHKYKSTKNLQWIRYCKYIAVISIILFPLLTTAEHEKTPTPDCQLWKGHLSTPVKLDNCYMAHDGDEQNPLKTKSAELIDVYLYAIAIPASALAALVLAFLVCVFGGYNVMCRLDYTPLTRGTRQNAKGGCGTILYIVVISTTIAVTIWISFHGYVIERRDWHYYFNIIRDFPLNFQIELDLPVLKEEKVDVKLSAANVFKLKTTGEMMNDNDIEQSSSKEFFNSTSSLYFKKIWTFKDVKDYETNSIEDIDFTLNTKNLNTSLHPQLRFLTLNEFSSNGLYPEHTKIKKKIYNNNTQVLIHGISIKSNASQVNMMVIPTKYWNSVDDLHYNSYKQFLLNVTDSPSPTDGQMHVRLSIKMANDLL